MSPTLPSYLSINEPSTISFLQPRYRSESTQILEGSFAPKYFTEFPSQYRLESTQIRGGPPSSESSTGSPSQQQSGSTQKLEGSPQKPSTGPSLSSQHQPESAQRQDVPRGPVNQFGFPRPSEQTPSSESATAKYYFVDAARWQTILDHGEFDDIVCGSGFCALAYIDRALEIDPYRKILVLERGGFFLPSHFQNLPLPFSLLLNDSSETYPWALTSKTFYGDLRFIHGSFPFFGGRSPFWSAWSPRPPLALLRDFPNTLKTAAKEEKFWDDCKKLLHVIEPRDLFNGEYQALQKYIEAQFTAAVRRKKKDVKADVRATRKKNESEIPSADYGEPASLAAGRTTGISQTVFEKFSTPGPLLKISDRQRKLAKEGKGSPLTIATHVTVERFDIDPEDKRRRVNVLQTSRGALCFPGDKKPNIILATGAIPACTIVLNSIETQQGRAGSRLGGHFLTHINARFPVPDSYESRRKEEKIRRAKRKMQATYGGSGNKFEHKWSTKHARWEKKEDGALQIAAYYLAGRAESGLQYHADITIIHSPRPEQQQEDVTRLCPDFFSTPSEAQMKGSEKHVIIACVMLGELNEKHTETDERTHKTKSVSRIDFDPRNPDLTTNVRAQLVLSPEDVELRQVMYDATLKSIEVMAGKNKGEIEYWRASNEGDGTGNWSKEKPDLVREFQMAGAVHESSTLYMDDGDDIDPKEYPAGDPKAKLRASVNSKYQLYGTDNVYVTGSALFPTSGSWNPTLMMCGFTQDLATKLCKPDIFKQVFSLSLASHLVNDCRDVKNPQESLQKGLGNVLPTIDAQWKLVWGPAVHQEDDTEPASWYIAHHQNLKFEHGSYPTYVISVAGTPRESLYQWFKPEDRTSEKVSDFVAWAESDVQKPPNAWEGKVAPDKAYVAARTLNTVHRLLTTVAPDGAESKGKTILDFIKDHKGNASVKFIFAGHGLGGALSASLALALVLAKVLTTVNTVTYTTAAPCHGNIRFIDLFATTFRSYKPLGESGYEKWNVNLVNTNDVVPQAWCASGLIAWKQNLSNVPSIYGDPIINQVWNTSLLAVIKSRASGVVYKPFPSQFFSTGRPEPKDFDDYRKIVHHQHVQAYADKFGITIPLLQRSQLLKNGLSEKTAAEKRYNYPLINDFEWANDNQNEAREILASVQSREGLTGWLWESRGEKVFR